MQIRDGLHQRQAQAAAWQAATLIESGEALRDTLMLMRGYARPGIAHIDHHRRRCAAHLDFHGAAGRRMLDGVVEQIGQRLEQQISIPAHQGLAVDLGLQAELFVLRNA